MILDCIFIGQPNKTLKMLERRIFASSVVLNETTLWVTGGIGEGGHSLYSTEFIPIDQPPIRDIGEYFKKIRFEYDKSQCYTDSRDRIVLKIQMENAMYPLEEHRL